MISSCIDDGSKGRFIVDQINIGLALVGLLCLVLALISDALQRSIVAPPLVAVATGVAVGPAGLGWLDVGTWGEQTKILEQAARLTLAVGLMGVALRLDKDCVRDLWKPTAVLLAVAMLGMWVVASLLLWWILDLPPLLALLIGAIVTPTDPVVATSIVTGNLAQQKVPLRVRTTLSLESGANDGLGYLLVFLPVLLIQFAPGEAMSKWFVGTVLWDVLFATAAGAFIGWASAKLLHLAEARQLLEEYSYLSLSIALTIFALAAVDLAGADGILAVFAAGLVFDFCADAREQHDEERIQETLSNLFMIPMFVLFGLVLPWKEWFELGWPLLGAAAAVLVLRRLPLLLVIQPLLRATYSRKELAFLGWFGPIGVAAVYYAQTAREKLGDQAESVWPITSLLVLSSVVVHGITAAPISGRYRASSERSQRDRCGVGD